MCPIYSGLATIVPPMSQISIDLLSNIDIFCSPGSRQVRKLYPLIIGDLNFKGIEIELLEGVAGHDVAFGLLTLQSRYSPITLVVTDAGTALRESVVNVKTGDGSMLFDNTTFHSLYTDRQSGNLIERYIQVIKNLLRTSVNSKWDHKIPTLTLTQFG